MRLLTFGDSLTVGFAARGQPETPYGARLARLLKDDTALRFEVDLKVSGRVLESAHAMPKRLERLLAEEPAPYDVACVLAGTNDLWTRDVDKIWASLTAMYGRLRAAGCERLAPVTLPPFAPAPLKWCGAVEATEACRLKLNDRIRALAEAESDVTVIDLAALCDIHTETMRLDDGIHLSPEGYEALGDEAFGVLRPLLC
jgi:lysophospholipase L1-like esterase